MIMVDDYMLFGVHSPLIGAGDIRKTPVSPVVTLYSHHPSRPANVTPIHSDLRQRSTKMETSVYAWSAVGILPNIGAERLDWFSRNAAAWSW
jgi:hypothetical protein